jgi:hypothetical protein
MPCLQLHIAAYTADALLDKAVQLPAHDETGWPAPRHAAATCSNVYSCSCAALTCVQLPALAAGT